MATQPKPKAVTPNFESVLDTPSTEVARPKALAQGTYVWSVRGLPRIDKSTKKGTEYSEYVLQCMEACEDVDPDALKFSLTRPSGEVTPIQERTIKYTLYHTEDALWRLKQFLDHCQIPEEDDDGNIRSIRERMQDVPGKILLGHIKHTPSDDGETMYANIDKTAKYEA